MYASIDGIKINYEIVGKGKPILLLHGWGGSWESLEAIGHQLSAKGFCGILLDLPGFGKSSRPKKDFSLDDYAEVIEKFLKQLGTSELFVFGHSFGGAVAIKLAVRGNVKIRKLILCNSSGVRKVEGKRLKVESFYVKITKKLFHLPLLSIVYPAIRKFYYYYILRNRDYIDYQEIAGTFRKVISEDLTPILHKVSVPTLLIWSELDKDTPLEYGKIMNSKIPDSRLEIIKGASHGLPKNKPNLIVNSIVKFLKS